MELDVSLGNESLSIPISDPFQIDINALAEQVENFIASKGEKIDDIDVKGLIPKMVRGIAGCEGGCPSNALELVDKGFKDFKLAYIDGGILTAKAVIGNGREISFKMFPDF